MLYSDSWLVCRYTPVDYARLHNQNVCADILANARGVTTQTIKEMAAVSIQATYKGYRLVLRSTVSKSVSVGSLSFTLTLQSSCPLLQANFREPCSHCHCCLLSRSLAAQKIQRTEEKALCSHQDPGVY